MGEDFKLESARCALRPLTVDDVADLQRILSDPEVVKGLVGDISTPERLERTARGWLVPREFWKANRMGNWGIFDGGEISGTSGRLVGVAGADHPPPAVGEGPECYYFVERSAWGRGVASEVMQTICTYLFGTLDVPAVEALIFAELNPGSVRVAEKLGMEPVGRVPLLGHHVNEDEALETIEFDVWRLRTSPPECAHETLTEAAFRIGQFVGEGVTDRKTVMELLVDAARSADTGNVKKEDDLRALITTCLAEGESVAGCLHYRVRQTEWSVP